MIVTGNTVGGEEHVHDSKGRTRILPLSCQVAESKKKDPFRNLQIQGPFFPFPFLSSCQACLWVGKPTRGLETQACAAACGRDTGEKKCPAAWIKP